MNNKCCNEQTRNDEHIRDENRYQVVRRKETHHVMVAAIVIIVIIIIIIIYHISIVLPYLQLNLKVKNYERERDSGNCCRLMVVVISLIFIASIHLLSDFLRTAHCFSVVKNSTIGPYDSMILWYVMYI